MAITRDESGSATLDRRALLTSLLLLLLTGGFISEAGSWFISREFTDRPMPRDLLFELLPYVRWARYLSTVSLTAGFVIFMVWAYRRARSRFPEFVTMFAIMYLLRAAIMVLDPTANAHGTGPYVFALIQNGMFPSGHVAVATLFTLLTDAERAPTLRRVQAILAIIVSAALVISHGHYSIDVVGGVLLSYFIEREWTTGRLFTTIKRFVLH